MKMKDDDERTLNVTFLALPSFGCAFLALYGGP